MTTPLYSGSGGWRSSNVRDRTRIGADIPFLASQNYTAKRSGCTFKKQTPGTGTNEVQTIASSGATAGTFTLTFGGPVEPGYPNVVTTVALPFNATAAAVQQALQNLSSVGAGNVTVAGGPANAAALVLTFTGRLGNQSQPVLVAVDRTGLTGAGATAVTLTTKGSPPNVVEIERGTFVIPDPSNPGYYRPWSTGDTINDLANGISGYIFESINVAFGDVTEGILIQGSVLKARVTPTPVPAAIATAVAGRITFQ